jgi:hypothetical protein
VIGPHGLDREIRRLIASHQAKLDTYLDIERRDFAAPSLSRPQRLQHAVLRAGIMAERSWLQWAGEVQSLLESADAGAVG